MNSTLPEDAGKISFLPQPITLTREAWRYWFAGQAMAGLTAANDCHWQTHEEYAVDARKFADALLAELERTKP